MNVKAPACEVFCFDEAKVGRLRPLLSSRDIGKAAQLFKALADETRLKIAYALTQEEELCVCDAAHIVGSTTATASHHLRLLYKFGLAKYRKEGKLVFYALEDDHVKQLVLLALTHVEEERGGAHGS